MGDDPGAVDGGGPSCDDSLRWVARIFTLAWARHEPPAQAIERRLGLARPTVTGWLRRARDRSLLTDPTQREYGTPEAGERAADLAAEAFRGEPLGG